MKSRKSFWQIVALIIGVLIVVCILVNMAFDNIVPQQITLFLFGSLVALGIGNSITNPSSSPVILSTQQETRFRYSQYIIGFIVSLILLLIIFFTELGKGSLVWLFLPIIILPFVLVFREWRKRT